MSGKLLLKLEAVNYLLQHHPAEHFAFLAERGNMRLRCVWTGLGCTSAFTNMLSGERVVVVGLGLRPAEHVDMFACLQPSSWIFCWCRPVFYSTLARLLFMEDTPAKFHSFVAPLQQACTHRSALPQTMPSLECLQAQHVRPGCDPDTDAQVQLMLQHDIACATLAT